jgi:hypothetical protein
MASETEEHSVIRAEPQGHGAGGRHGRGPQGVHEEPHEGAPEWLISFADNVTLMMGFFVILLALNMRPTPKGDGRGSAEVGEGAVGAVSPELLDWAIGVRAAFNNPVDITSTDPRDQLLVQRLTARTGRGPARDPGPKGTHEETQTIRPSDYYGGGGVVSFDTGGTELTPQAQETARDIAANLRGFQSVIELRGHVSAAEAHQLDGGGISRSYERALAVAQALVKEGIEWKRLRLIACGANEPLVAPAYDEATHRANQRVEVIVTDRTAGYESDPRPTP